MSDESMAKRDSFSSVAMPPANEFGFGKFFEEQARAQPFYERPVPSFEALRSDIGKGGSAQGGLSATPAVGDSAALEGWRNVSVLVPIALWISLSSAVILMNKWILTDLGFSYPIALTTIHLAFQTIASRLLHKYTNLVDGAKTLEQTGKMNRQVFMRNIVPIGLLFSVSLVLSNWVYLRLSVSFIQMIKAITPVVVLAVSVLFKVKTANAKLWGIVSIISLGVGIASYGELDFDLLGFSVQLFAILVESCRLVLIQILLQGFGMDPLVSLYYFAPVCLATNTVALVFTEGLEPLSKIMQVGPVTLLFNASCTFFLNLASVWLIGRASGLVLTLSGVVKDILLIAGSFAILGSVITGTQVFGYVIALAGLILFKTQG